MSGYLEKLYIPSEWSRRGDSIEKVSVAERLKGGHQIFFPRTYFGTPIYQKVSSWVVTKWQTETTRFDVIYDMRHQIHDELGTPF